MTDPFDPVLVDAAEVISTWCFEHSGYPDCAFRAHSRGVDANTRYGIAQALREAGLLTTPTAQAELEHLRYWKTEALAVLGEWEKVWEAAARPGRLGSSKAEAVRDWIAQRTWGL